MEFIKEKYVELSVIENNTDYSEVLVNTSDDVSITENEITLTKAMEVAEFNEVVYAAPEYTMSIVDEQDVEVTSGKLATGYKVVVKTEGGHSYNAFGNKNAIAILSQIINKIYEIEVPVNGNSKTTYNVGIISGGTSVNTIAQSAEMLCEYRSDDLKCFDIMKQSFHNIFNDIKEKYPMVEIDVELAGDRPCMGNVDKEEMEKLTQFVKNVQAKCTNCEIEVKSGSTDCNIPHSLGIPAICVGVYEGGGVHTREEYLKKDSIINGLDILHQILIAE